MKGWGQGQALAGPEWLLHTDVPLPFTLDTSLTLCSENTDPLRTLGPALPFC